MGTNTLEMNHQGGETVEAAHVNELAKAMCGDFVARSTAGVPSPQQSLGTLAIPWRYGYIQNLIINGQALDAGKITSPKNRIVSGKTRTLSELPMFIKPSGVDGSLTIEAAETALLLDINGVTVTINSDLSKAGLTLSSGLETALVNDTSLTGDLASKYAGEDDSTIIIDTLSVSAEALIGQHVVGKVGTELFFGYLKSATEITNVFRGFFFDQDQNPIVRQPLTNNDTITFLKLGHVFIENNGTTVDVSYRTPQTSYVAPSSPGTGDYWYDIQNNVWKRYSGAEWEIINRMYVGMAVMDDTACIACRCADFYRNFAGLNNIELEIDSAEIVKSKSDRSLISVYGNIVGRTLSKCAWNITDSATRETGVTETADTVYYLYLTEKGKEIISDEKPHWRDDLQGDYHPYHSWRMVGITYNDSSSDIALIADYFSDSQKSESSGTFVTSSLTAVEITNQKIIFLNIYRGRRKIFIGFTQNEGVISNFRADTHGAYGASATFYIYKDEINFLSTRLFGYSTNDTERASNDCPCSSFFHEFDSSQIVIRFTGKATGTGNCNAYAYESCLMARSIK